MRTNRTESAVEALAVPVRRAILERLRAGPLPVVTLARGLPVSRPAVSQHLKILKDAGLVHDHPAGARRYYAINPEGFFDLREYLETFWNAALASFKTAAERKATPRGRRDR